MTGAGKPILPSGASGNPGRRLARRLDGLGRTLRLTDIARMARWREEDCVATGWAPQDSADGWAAEFADTTGGDPIAEWQQGGCCALGYSRPAP